MSSLFQMAQLWTILGQNRREVAIFNEHRDLLADVARYRNLARDRVKGTVDQLYQLSEDLSELRDRVVRPVLVGGDGVIPLEVHLDSLRRGVEKLSSFRQQGIDRYVLQLFLKLYGVWTEICIPYTGRTRSCEQFLLTHCLKATG